MAGHIAEGNWAITNFFFRVTFDGTQLSFSEVSGLETTNDAIEYRHGDHPEFITTKRIGMTKTSTLSFKKGVFSGDDHLTTHFNQVYDKHFMSTTDGRIDLLIELLDELENTVMSWNVHNFIPTKLNLGGLKSVSTEIAIETLEGVYEKMSVTL